MTGQSKKAYLVYDGDEQTVVVFATNGATARRQGANEMDVSFEEVESCRRERSLDAYAETEIVPIQAMLDLGWWFECTGCGRRIDQELVEDPAAAWDYEDEKPLPVMSPIGTYRSLCFCTPTCRDTYLEEKLLRESAEELAVRRLARWVTGRYPDVVVDEGRCHAYADRHGRIREVLAVFNFPGSRWGGARAEGLPPEVKLNVVDGDHDAWRRYREEAWAYPDLPRVVRRFER